MFGVTAASRNTRFQATCQALPGPDLHRLIAPSFVLAHLFDHLINPFWYRKERDTAAAIVKVQNEKLAELCASRPDRFAAFTQSKSFVRPSNSCQFGVQGNYSGPRSPYLGNGQRTIPKRGRCLPPLSTSYPVAFRLSWCWRRLHGHRRVILTTMFREDYAAILLDRSAACHRLRSRWGEISHVDDMIRYLLRGSVLQRPHLS